MLDQSLSHPDIAQRQQQTLARPCNRPRSPAAATFLGVDLVVRRDGSDRDLVHALNQTGLGKVFTLSHVARGGQTVWTVAGDGIAALDADTPRHGWWRVRFDAVPPARSRAEAHLPRLLENVSLRLPWQHVEKRYAKASAADRPRGSLPSGDWSARPLPHDLLTGDVA